MQFTWLQLSSCCPSEARYWMEACFIWVAFLELAHHDPESGKKILRKPKVANKFKVHQPVMDW